MIVEVRDLLPQPLFAREMLGVSHLVPDIIRNPPAEWLRNLTEGCHVWLPKLYSRAFVVAPFLPPIGQARTGRLFIQVHGVIEYWFVSADGLGIDGSRIMEPLQGSLPTTRVRLGSDEAENLRLEIARLRFDLNELRVARGFLPSVTPVRPPALEISDYPTMWENLLDDA